ncbi:GDSL esterase/lipase-like protein [Tanacetum coccineum]
MGNNDFINNYFSPEHYQTSSLYTPEEYAELLVQQYSKQLSILYKYGARKFGIPGSSYSGCALRDGWTRYNTNVCVDAINGAVVQFNAKLVAALGELESKLTGAKFIYMNPSLGYSTDFNVTDKPCCTASTTIGAGQCAPNQVPCDSRQNYVFWDAFHPTESISLVDGAEHMKPYPHFMPMRLKFGVESPSGAEAVLYHGARHILKNNFHSDWVIGNAVLFDYSNAFQLGDNGTTLLHEHRSKNGSGIAANSAFPCLYLDDVRLSETLRKEGKPFPLFDNGLRSAIEAIEDVTYLCFLPSRAQSLEFARTHSSGCGIDGLILTMDMQLDLCAYEIVKELGVTLIYPHCQKAVLNVSPSSPCSEFLDVIPIEGLSQHMSALEYQTILKYRLMIPLSYNGFNKGMIWFMDDSSNDVLYIELEFLLERRPVNFLTDPLEGRSTLRPADILVFGWAGGKHACVDIQEFPSCLGLRDNGFVADIAAMKSGESSKVANTRKLV